MSKEFTRRETRSLIFHLMYAVESFDYDIDLDDLVEQFNEYFETDMDPEGEIVQVTRGIIEKRDELKEYLVPFFSNWRIERIGCCTRIVLYMALWEMLNLDTPKTVVINEAIELAKGFSERDAYKFVNGVLDKIVKKLEPEDKSQSEDEKGSEGILEREDKLEETKESKSEKDSE
jgi:transcription antitermination protein NusB